MSRTELNESLADLLGQWDELDEGDLTKADLGDLAFLGAAAKRLHDDIEYIAERLAEAGKSAA